MSFFEQVDSDEPYVSSKKRPQTAVKPLDFFTKISSKKPQRNNQSAQSSHALQTVESNQQQRQPVIQIKVQSKKQPSKKRRESQKAIVGQQELK